MPQLSVFYHIKKKKFRQHIMFSVLKEWGSTSQSVCWRLCCHAIAPGSSGIGGDSLLFFSATLASANKTGDSGHELWLGVLRQSCVTSWDPLQSTFLESIENLHSPESVTQGSYSRASQMASHICVMAAASCPLISKIKESDAAELAVWQFPNQAGGYNPHPLSPLG